MSKIIKAADNQSFQPFSFAEIETGEERPNVPVPATEGGIEPGPVGADPLDDIEQVIQQRLLDAERKAQEMEREAYEQGYAQGLNDGSEYGRKSMAIVKDHMEQLLTGLQVLPEKAFKDYRGWFIAACIAVSRKIVRKELELQPELLIQTIDSVLREAEASHSLTLHLHPKDIDLLTKHTDFISLIQQSGRSLTLRPDPQIERGGCRLESEIQLIDSTLETQFSLIEEALLRHEQAPDDSSS